MLILLILTFFCLTKSFQLRDDDYSNGPWRKSLDSCWTDPTCKRVLTCAHGGEWNVTFPYDSLPAMEQAFVDGADAVKGDFRVAKDNIGVVMHSSPVEFYESLNCFGKYVEEMTSEECTKCQMEITQYTFMTVPDFLAWANEKVNVMLCIKEPQDIPRAITTLIENNASHRAFLEIGVNDLLLLEANEVPYWKDVYYVVNIDNQNDLQRMVEASSAVKQRGFLIEFNGWDDWEGLEDDIKTAEANGFRSFAATKDNAVAATVNNHLKLYNAGFDVAYTYNLTNAVIARKQINEQNGISPP